VSPTAALIGPAAGVASVLSVFRGWHGAWIAISKRDDFLGTYISGWTAQTPSGPWQLTFPTLAAIPSFTADPNELLYNPLVHPEARLESGKLLISYSRNSFNFDRLLEDADYYGLRFVEVSLAA
jgi:hypothetical protein